MQRMCIRPGCVVTGPSTGICYFTFRGFVILVKLSCRSSSGDFDELNIEGRLYNMKVILPKGNALKIYSI